MITSALLRTETERWREMSYLSSSEVLSAGFLAGLAWHDARVAWVSILALKADLLIIAWENEIPRKDLDEYCSSRNDGKCHPLLITVQPRCGGSEKTA
jgi:hypothetical protein